MGRLALYYRFIGRRAALFGALGVGCGFALFGLDLALAMMLQRFFMATGLVTMGTDMPLGIPLGSPLAEAAMLVVVGFARGLVMWANGYFGGLCQVAVETEKRSRLTQWAISSGDQEIGTTMTYFNDIVLGAAASIGNAFYVMSRLVILSGLFIVMIGYSWVIAAFVVALIVMIAPLQIVIDRMISRNSSRIQSSLAEAVSSLARGVKNNLFITLHNLVGEQVSHTRGAIDEYGRASVRYYSMSSLRSVLPQVLGLVAVAAIAIHGAENFRDNPGRLVACLYLVLRLFQVISDLARVSASLRLNHPRISKLFQWWSAQVDGRSSAVPISDSEDARPVGWSAHELTYQWANGHRTAIRGLDFDIAPGTSALILGPSGSGKTTLFHLLLGLLTPTAGTLTLIEERDTRVPVEGRIRQRISYVGPDPFLIAGTVRDQLLTGNAAMGDDVLAAALRRVHADFVFDFPDGLSHVLTEQGHGLSAGQKQRIALARAILRNPSVLLLDEATANLDAATERLVVELVNSLRGKMTILVISHRPHDALAVDTVVDLDGRTS